MKTVPFGNSELSVIGTSVGAAFQIRDAVAAHALSLEDQKEMRDV